MGNCMTSNKVAPVFTPMEVIPSTQENVNEHPPDGAGLRECRREYYRGETLPKEY